MKSHITSSNYLFLKFTSKYNKNMTKLRRLFRFIARIDNFNRIIVFVSMTLFIVLPSMYLYKTTNENYSFDVVMPSTFLLGLIIGNGLLVLYKPLRSTWLYFLICIIAFPFIYFVYDFQVVSFFISYIIIAVYFIVAIQSTSVRDNVLATILLIGLLTLPIIIVSSLLYPLDFKYLFYFNVFLILVLSIISCSTYKMNPFILIFAIILVGISFLITLIVEGRTWTGANPD